MNKFLKLAIIPVAFLVTGTSTSCSVSPREIALITDIGDIDDGSFNQESWEACKQYATDHHKTVDFYRPFNDSEFARRCAVKQAVAKGAQVIILPGFKFASTCAAMMEKYPEIHFLLIDSPVHRGDYIPIDAAPNASCIGFNCEYSGFIAGYAIAQDLMQRDLTDTGKVSKQYGYGYMGGMSQSGVYEFGYGYIQGICRGTYDFCENHKDVIKDADKPKVLIQYDYAGVFAQDDKAAIKVKSWYTAEGDENVKVVFPCGGKLYQSVTEAAQYYNKHYVKNYDDWYKGKLDRDPREAARWVGVDSDQYRGLKYDYELKSIYTSALKGLNPAIVHAIDLHYKGEWEKRIGGVHIDPPDAKVGAGGQWILGLNSIFGDYKDAQPEPDNFVGIPDVYDEETRIMRGFDNYTYDDFLELYDKLIHSRSADYIPVCGDSGAITDPITGEPTEGGWCDYDLGIYPGYPYDMVNWRKKIDGTEVSYHDSYLKYPKELIDIRSPRK